MTDNPATAQISVNATVSVKLDMLTNLLVGAFEGGSWYWIAICVYLTDMTGKESPAYSDPTFWVTGGRVRLIYVDPNPKDGKEIAQFDMGLPEMTKGLEVMSNKYPRHFGDLISENDDATTSDVYMQCVIFGEVIYG